MNKLFLIFFLIISFSLSAQTVYYSTNGKNRLTKEELDIKLAKEKKEFEKIMKKEVFVNYTKNKSKKKGDSIIHFMSLEISTSKERKKPASEFIGKKIPKVVLRDINGKEFITNQTNGKPTLINFWFTSCKPCIDEIPVLNKIYDEYKDQYNFIAVTFQSGKKAGKFLKNTPYKFRQIVDAKKFAKELGIESYPVNLFIDSNGILKYSEDGIPYESDENGKSKMGDGKDFIKKLKTLK